MVEANSDPVNNDHLREPIIFLWGYDFKGLRSLNQLMLILYLKFKVSNHKLVFISRVVVILPGISFRR